MLSPLIPYFNISTSLNKALLVLNFKINSLFIVKKDAIDLGLDSEYGQGIARAKCYESVF